MLAIDSSRTIRSRGPFKFLTSIIVGGALLSSAWTAVANDVSAPGSVCNATYLEQAFPMRWHENYLMNPSWNPSTWVICPVTYDNDIVPPARFNVGVFGSLMPGASPTLPTCFVAITNLMNTTQDPFRTGNGRKYTKYLPISVSNSDNWIAEAPLFYDEIAPYAGPNPNSWVVTIYCELSSGYSITGFLGSDDI